MLFSMFYDKTKGQYTIAKAETYQINALDKFIKSLPNPVDHTADNTKHYIADNDTGITASSSMPTHAQNHNDAIVFNLNTFNYKELHLQGEYNDFYELITHDGTKYMLSTNEVKLKGFCGWINRITT